MQLIFWKKPINDTDTFKLFLFLVGNGASPEYSAEWILTSQSWAENDRTAEKRARQLDYIFNNFTVNNHKWFYYDLFTKNWQFLNGCRRDINN